MSKINTLAARFIRDESGASLVEYSVLIGLITAGAILLIGNVGATVVAKWTVLDTNFN
jgi:pilus assembly protein Flp/PilA